MRRILTVIALVLLITSPSFALSDAEYLRMRRNSIAFARADKNLNRVWANLRKSMPKKVFAELEEMQHEWIRDGRDIEAQVLIDDGLSKVEAYTSVTNDRAKALPKLAEDLRNDSKTSRTQPAPNSKPAPEPEPEPEPEIVQKQEADDSDSQKAVNPEGEYESKNCFMTVKIIDSFSMEVEVSFARWKDEVNWKASGWVDDDVLELSDANYSTCHMTIYFDPDRARVVPYESEDWAKITADDFVIRGTYMKK